MVIINYCYVSAVYIAFRDDFWGDLFIPPFPLWLAKFQGQKNLTHNRERD
jgi:hypothetical protein